MVDRILEESGVERLHNRSQRIQVQGHELTLVGVGDLWSDEINAEAAFRPGSGKGPTVLLSHNPDSKGVLGGLPGTLCCADTLMAGRSWFLLKEPDMRRSRINALLRAFGPGRDARSASRAA